MRQQSNFFIKMSSFFNLRYKVTTAYYSLDFILLENYTNGHGDDLREILVDGENPQNLRTNV